MEETNDMSDVKQTLISIYNSKDAFEEVEKAKDNFVILVNGKRIKTRSGKSVWPNRGAAKNALRHHLNGIINIYNTEGLPKREDGRLNYSEARQIIQEAEDEWIENHVVFMPLSDYLKLLKKRSS